MSTDTAASEQLQTDTMITFICLVAFAVILVSIVLYKWDQNPPKIDPTDDIRYNSCLNDGTSTPLTRLQREREINNNLKTK